VPDPQPGLVPAPVPAPQENKDYSFPGAGPGVGGGIEAAQLASHSLHEALPLLGSLWDLGSAGLHAWDAHTYQGIADDEKKQGFDPAQQKSNQEAADHASEEAEGDLINAIPLVGFARFWM
jgi:hypothetical protein